jgi:Protein of unknown function (DUF998)
MTETTATGITPIPIAREPKRLLLQAGVVAGPLFLVVAFIQALVQPDFNIAHHPISALTLGATSWVQIGSFIATGVLAITFALGVRRAIRGEPGSTWGPIFFAGLGLGLVAAGLFVPDPAFGFPAGAPEGMPTSLSTHAVVHGIGFSLAVACLVAATLVFTRRYAVRRTWALAAYSVVSGVVILVMGTTPPGDGASLRYAIATAVGWAWVTVVALRLLTDRPPLDSTTNPTVNRQEGDA